MYAVIKTGGKQYRVKPGDMLIVEKLTGDAGAEVSFDQVLALGEGADVQLGAPLVEGALVKATLVETRKGEKIKIFKKIRRQGYRRTRGHRQQETVLRVTSIAGAGKSESWDGTVELTTRAMINARARGLKSVIAALEAQAAPTAAEAPAAKAKKAPAPAPKAEVAAEAAAAPAPAPKAAKAEAAKPAPAKKAAAKAPAAEAKPKTEQAAPKPRATKAKPASDGGKA